MKNNTGHNKKSMLRRVLALTAAAGMLFCGFYPATTDASGQSSADTQTAEENLIYTTMDAEIQTQSEPAYSITPGELEASKTLTDNGDGTYNITLSVTGKVKENTAASKMNVVIVFDKSYSMNKSVTLSDGSTSTRLAEAKEAAGSLIDSLADLNKTYKDTVEMACVAFSGDAEMKTHNGLNVYSDVTDSTATLSDLKSEINGIQTANTEWNNYEAGTNWEAGLNMANSVSFQGREDVPTYVVFITDGDPTLRNSLNGLYDEIETYEGQDGTEPEDYPGSFGNETNYQDYSYYTPAGDDKYKSSGVWGTGVSDSKYSVSWSGNNYQMEIYEHLNKHAAQVEAKNIVSSGKNFYAIRIFNSEASEKRLQDVVTYAYDNNVSLSGTDSHYYDATTVDQLNTALTNIGTVIKYASAFKDVKVYDTLTGLTDADIRTDSTKFTYTKTVDGVTSSWTDAPTASITDGKVSWDLSDIGELENNVTYSVTFRVWPDQDALDLVAQLNNASADEAETLWTSISTSHPEIVREQQSDGTYHYKLNTNIDKSEDNDPDSPYVSYTHVDKTIPGPDNTTTGLRVDLTNPNPVPLWDAEMTIEKLWKDSSGNTITNEELANEKIDHITAVIKDHDNTNNKDTDYMTVEIKKGTDGKWKSDTIHLAVGLVDKYKDGNVRDENNRKNADGTVLEKGHVYSVTEATVYYTDDTYKTIDTTGYNSAVDGTVQPMLDDWEKAAGEGTTYDLNDYTVVYVGNENQVFTVTNTKNAADSVDVELQKIDSNKTNGTKTLEGVIFKLCKVEGETETLKQDNITSDKNGIVSLTGLEAGTYKLYETKAKDGYFLPEDPWTITVEEKTDGSGFTVTVTAPGDTTGKVIDENDPTTYQIENSEIYELPSTDGIGTTPFKTAGLIIMLIAVLAYINYWKMSRERGTEK